MHWLFVTDPWDTLDHPRDTSLRLMQAAASLGIRAYWNCYQDIRLEGSRVVVRAWEMIGCSPTRAKKDFAWKEWPALRAEKFSQIHYRADPPLTVAYRNSLGLLHASLTLSRSKKTEIVNPAEIVLTSSEKWEPLFLPPYCPATLVSRKLDELHAFGRKERRTVLKPVYSAQSMGVAVLDWNTPDEIRESETRLREATEGFKNPVVLQRFFEGVSEGETRLWFVDGKLLTHVRKRPARGQAIINMDRGGSLSVEKLTARESRAASAIGKHLKNRRIRLAAVDLIEGWITDFNYTTPGLIPVMEEFLGTDLATPIVRALQSKRRSSTSV